MSLTVDCKNLKGKVTVPYSKSMAHRYLLATFLSGNYDAVKNFDETNISDDVLATKRCLVALIDGNQPVKLNVGESGTTLRLLTSVVAALGLSADFITSGNLANRPMKALTDELARHTSGGKLQPGEYRLPGNVSSQYVSSLLFALPLLDGDSKLTIDGELESKPYVDLTLQTLEIFGIEIKIERNGYAVSGNQKYVYPNDAKSLLEGDWSQGAMWLAANSILNSLEIAGLDEDSLQADAFIQDILEIEDDLDVIVSAMDCPDLVPAIVLWALPRNGKTTITDIKRLKYKESDRLEALRDIINKLGGNAELVNNNTIIVNLSKQKLSAPNEPINTYNDHRIVMFASLASMLTDGAITIDTPEAVKKSYPNFFDEIENLGGILRWN